jgi:hypothetical protein
VPDALFAGGDTPDAAAQVQCPWCLETLEGRELSAVLPPALVLVGAHAALTANTTGDTAAEENWGTDNWSDTARSLASPAAATAMGAVATGAGTLGIAGKAIGDAKAELPSLDFPELSSLDSPDTADLSVAEQELLDAPSLDGLDAPELDELDIVDVDADLQLPEMKVHDTDFSNMETVEELQPLDSDEPVNFVSEEFGDAGVSEETSDIETNLPEMNFSDAEMLDENVEMLDDDVANIPTIDEDTDASELTFQEPAPVQRKTPEVMMDVSSTRRRRSDGMSIKKVLPVALGGLLSLPIVGTILHYVKGTHVPVLSDFLPGGGGGSAPQLRANTPAPQYNSSDLDEPVLIDDGPLAGRDLAGRSNSASPDVGMDAATNAALGAIAAAANSDPDAMPELDFSKPIEDPSELEPADLAAADEPIASVPEMTATLNADDPFSASPTNTDDLLADTPEPTDAPEPTTPAFDADGAVSEVSQSLDALAAMPTTDPDRAEAIQQAYESLSKLVGDVPAEAKEKLQPLLSKVAGNMPLVVAFAKATPDWLARSADDRGTEGAIVVGKLTGDASSANMLLSNRQELPVTLPTSVDAVPEGVQIGLGIITGSGRDASISLDLLQTVK